MSEPFSFCWVSSLKRKPELEILVTITETERLGTFTAEWELIYQAGSGGNIKDELSHMS